MFKCNAARFGDCLSDKNLRKAKTILSMFGSSVGFDLTITVRVKTASIKSELNEYLWCLGMKSGDYKTTYGDSIKLNFVEIRFLIQYNK